MRKINGVPFTAHIDLSSLTGGEVIKWDGTNTLMAWEDQDDSAYVPLAAATGNQYHSTTGGHGHANVTNLITINTTGNATTGSTLSADAYNNGGCSNQTRGVIAGGRNSGTYYNRMEYITFSSIDGGTDFGDLTVSRGYLHGKSNQTGDRGFFAGGYSGSALNVIDYITISTTGNATDFGDLTSNYYNPGISSNGVKNRAIITAYSVSQNTIDYITISSAGNATDFGDMTTSRRGAYGCSNDINDRGIISGDRGNSGIEYVTISTTGNATSFGSLTQGYDGGGCDSNGTGDRGIFAGGENSPGYTNIIEYITISTTGNSTDFGDMTASMEGWSSCVGAA